MTGERPQGKTHLMTACEQGRTLEAKVLLQKKPQSISTRDKHGKTALHYCAESGALACAQLLLSGVDRTLLDAPDSEGFTPLHLAIISGHRAIAKLLLKAGADPDSVDKERHSAVHWAAVCGDVESIDLLLKHGASPSTPDILGAYPIHYAAQMCGAHSLNGKDPETGLNTLRKLVERGASIQCRDKDGREPLLWAASAGSSEAVLVLFTAGANVATSDKDGLTALHCAASRGHTGCVETLITLCGSRVDEGDHIGCSPLFYSAAQGQADCTQVLLKQGADPCRQDNKGRTPAHCASVKGRLEILRILDSNGADLWIRNSRGNLPLHEAVVSGRKDLVQWLLQQCPRAVNATNISGRTPLHIAAQRNNVEMCEVLIDYGAFINPLMVNAKGFLMTPLDASVYQGNQRCAKYLQLHGAVPATKVLENNEINRNLLFSLGNYAYNQKERSDEEPSTSAMFEQQKNVLQPPTVRDTQTRTIRGGQQPPIQKKDVPPESELTNVLSEEATDASVHIHLTRDDLWSLWESLMQELTSEMSGSEISQGSERKPKVDRKTSDVRQLKPVLTSVYLRRESGRSQVIAGESIMDRSAEADAVATRSVSEDTKLRYPKRATDDFKITLPRVSEAEKSKSTEEERHTSSHISGMEVEERIIERSYLTDSVGSDTEHVSATTTSKATRFRKRRSDGRSWGKELEESETSSGHRQEQRETNPYLKRYFQRQTRAAEMRKYFESQDIQNENEYSPTKRAYEKLDYMQETNLKHESKEEHRKQSTKYPYIVQGEKSPSSKKGRKYLSMSTENLRADAPSILRSRTSSISNLDKVDLHHSVSRRHSREHKHKLCECMTKGSGGKSVKENWHAEGCRLKRRHGIESPKKSSRKKRGTSPTHDSSRKSSQKYLEVPSQPSAAASDERSEDIPDEEVKLRQHHFHHHHHHHHHHHRRHSKDLSPSPERDKLLSESNHHLERHLKHKRHFHRKKSRSKDGRYTAETFSERNTLSDGEYHQRTEDFYSGNDMSRSKSEMSGFPWYSTRDVLTQSPVPEICEREGSELVEAEQSKFQVNAETIGQHLKGKEVKKTTQELQSKISGSLNDVRKESSDSKSKKGITDKKLKGIEDKTKTSLGETSSTELPETNKKAHDIKNSSKRKSEREKKSSRVIRNIKKSSPRREAKKSGKPPLRAAQSFSETLSQKTKEIPLKQKSQSARIEKDVPEIKVFSAEGKETDILVRQDFQLSDVTETNELTSSITSSSDKRESYSGNEKMEESDTEYAMKNYDAEVSKAEVDQMRAINADNQNLFGADECEHVEDEGKENSGIASEKEGEASYKTRTSATIKEEQNQIRLTSGLKFLDTAKESKDGLTDSDSESGDEDEPDEILYRDDNYVPTSLSREDTTHMNGSIHEEEEGENTDLNPISETIRGVGGEDGSEKGETTKTSANMLNIKIDESSKSKEVSEEKEIHGKDNLKVFGSKTLDVTDKYDQENSVSNEENDDKSCSLNIDSGDGNKSDEDASLIQDSSDVRGDTHSNLDGVTYQKITDLDPKPQDFDANTKGKKINRIVQEETADDDHLYEEDFIESHEKIEKDYESLENEKILENIVMYEKLEKEIQLEDQNVMIDTEKQAEVLNEIDTIKGEKEASDVIDKTDIELVEETAKNHVIHIIQRAESEIQKQFGNNALEFRDSVLETEVNAQNLISNPTVKITEGTPNYDKAQLVNEDEEHFSEPESTSEAETRFNTDSEDIEPKPDLDIHLLSEEAESTHYEDEPSVTEEKVDPNSETAAVNKASVEETQKAKIESQEENVSDHPQELSSKDARQVPETYERRLASNKADDTVGKSEENGENRKQLGGKKSNEKDQFTLEKEHEENLDCISQTMQENVTGKEKEENFEHTRRERKENAERKEQDLEEGGKHDSQGNIENANISMSEEATKVINEADNNSNGKIVKRSKMDIFKPKRSSRAQETNQTTDVLEEDSRPTDIKSKTFPSAEVQTDISGETKVFEIGVNVEREVGNLIGFNRSISVQTSDYDSCVGAVLEKNKKKGEKLISKHEIYKTISIQTEGGSSVIRDKTVKHSDEIKEAIRRANYNDISGKYRSFATNMPEIPENTTENIQSEKTTQVTLDMINRSPERQNPSAVFYKATPKVVALESPKKENVGAMFYTTASLKDKNDVISKSNPNIPTIADKRDNLKLRQPEGRRKVTRSTVRDRSLESEKAVAIANSAFRRLNSNGELTVFNSSSLITVPHNASIALVESKPPCHRREHSNLEKSGFLWVHFGSGSSPITTLKRKPSLTSQKVKRESNLIQGHSTSVLKAGMRENKTKATNVPPTNRFTRREIHREANGNIYSRTKTENSTNKTSPRKSTSVLNDALHVSSKVLTDKKTKKHYDHKADEIVTGERQRELKSRIPHKNSEFDSKRQRREEFLEEEKLRKSQMKNERDFMAKNRISDSAKNELSPRRAIPRLCREYSYVKDPGDPCKISRAEDPKHPEEIKNTIDIERIYTRKELYHETSLDKSYKEEISRKGGSRKQSIMENDLEIDAERIYGQKKTQDAVMKEISNGEASLDDYDEEAQSPKQSKIKDPLDINSERTYKQKKRHEVKSKDIPPETSLDKFDKGGVLRPKQIKDNFDIEIPRTQKQQKRQDAKRREMSREVSSDESDKDDTQSPKQYKTKDNLDIELQDIKRRELHREVNSNRYDKEETQSPKQSKRNDISDTGIEKTPKQKKKQDTIKRREILLEAGSDRSDKDDTQRPKLSKTKDNLDIEIVKSQKQKKRQDKKRRELRREISSDRSDKEETQSPKQSKRKDISDTGIEKTRKHKKQQDMKIREIPRQASSDRSDNYDTLSPKQSKDNLDIEMEKYQKQKKRQDKKRRELHREVSSDRSDKEKTLSPKQTKRKDNLNTDVEKTQKQKKITDIKKREMCRERSSDRSETEDNQSPKQPKRKDNSDTGIESTRKQKKRQDIRRTEKSREASSDRSDKEEKQNRKESKTSVAMHDDIAPEDSEKYKRSTRRNRRSSSNKREENSSKTKIRTPRTIELETFEKTEREIFNEDKENQMKRGHSRETDKRSLKGKEKRSPKKDKESPRENDGGSSKRTAKDGPRDNKQTSSNGIEDAEHYEERYENLESRENESSNLKPNGDPNRSHPRLSETAKSSSLDEGDVKFVIERKTDPDISIKIKMSDKHKKGKKVKETSNTDYGSTQCESDQSYLKDSGYISTTESVHRHRRSITIDLGHTTARINAGIKNTSISNSVEKGSLKDIQTSGMTLPEVDEGKDVADDESKKENQNSRMSSHKVLPSKLPVLSSQRQRSNSVVLTSYTRTPRRNSISSNRQDDDEVASENLNAERRRTLKDKGSIRQVGHDAENSPRKLSRTGSDIPIHRAQSDSNLQKLGHPSPRLGQSLSTPSILEADDGFLMSGRMMDSIVEHSLSSTDIRSDVNKIDSRTPDNLKLPSILLSRPEETDLTGRSSRKGKFPSISPRRRVSRSSKFSSPVPSSILSQDFSMRLPILQQPVRCRCNIEPYEFWDGRRTKSAVECVANLHFLTEEEMAQFDRRLFAVGRSSFNSGIRTTQVTPTGYRAIRTQTRKRLRSGRQSAESVTFHVDHDKERNSFKLPTEKLKKNKKWKVVFTIGKSGSKNKHHKDEEKKS